MQEYVLEFCHRHEREKVGVPNTWLEHSTSEEINWFQVIDIIIIIYFWNLVLNVYDLSSFIQKEIIKQHEPRQMYLYNGPLTL